MSIMSADQSHQCDKFPDEQEIRTQLAIILANQTFEATQRGRRFLEFVVEETLSGRSNRIKAFTVATKVFGRKADFDPQNDPLVRIEAGRLRRELERYYLLAGQSDRILISIPKGGYVPEFRYLSDPVAASLDVVARSPSHRQSPNLYVLAVAAGALIFASSLFLRDLHTHLAASTASGELQVSTVPSIVGVNFETLDQSAELTRLANALTDELVGQLARVGRHATAHEEPAGRAITTDTSASKEDRYVVVGRLRRDAKNIRISARLTAQSEGSVIWADSYDVNLASLNSLDIETRVAQQIVAAISQSAILRTSSGQPKVGFRVTEPTRD